MTKPQKRVFCPLSTAAGLAFEFCRPSGTKFWPHRCVMSLRNRRAWSRRRPIVSPSRLPRSQRSACTGVNAPRSMATTHRLRVYIGHTMRIDKPCRNVCRDTRTLKSPVCAGSSRVTFFRRRWQWTLARNGPNHVWFEAFATQTTQRRGAQLNSSAHGSGATLPQRNSRLRYLLALK